jgi:hypothetical protein
VSTNRTKKKIVWLIILVFAIQMLVTPSASQAKWRSHYDDMPGTDTGEALKKAAIIGVGAGLLLVTVMMITKNNKKHKVDEASADTSSSPEENVSENEPADNDTNNLPSEENQKSGFGLYFEVNQNRLGPAPGSSDFDISDLAVEAGIKIGF